MALESFVDESLALLILGRTVARCCIHLHAQGLVGIRVQVAHVQGVFCLLVGRGPWDNRHSPFPSNATVSQQLETTTHSRLSNLSAKDPEHWVTGWLQSFKAFRSQKCCIRACKFAD